MPGRGGGGEGPLAGNCAASCPPAPRTSMAWSNAAAAPAQGRCVAVLAASLSARSLRPSHRGFRSTHQPPACACSRATPKAPKTPTPKTPALSLASVGAACRVWRGAPCVPPASPPGRIPWRALDDIRDSEHNSSPSRPHLPDRAAPTTPLPLRSSPALWGCPPRSWPSRLAGHGAGGNGRVPRRPRLPCGRARAAKPCSRTARSLRGWRKSPGWATWGRAAGAPPV